MPLIEAFLAFALTMLAFATAVSAVVGIWLRALRWRAAGLRRSLEALYDREIEPRLGKAKAPPDEADRLTFIMDMTCSLDAEPGRSLEDTRRQRLEELRKAYRIDPPDRKPAARSSATASVPSAWRALMSRVHHWRSLRFGMDGLPESQFRLRLTSSAAWERLKGVRDPASLAADEDYLTRWFTEIGVVATEAFSRRSRVRTVIAGLLLAALINADAFDLLNSYMTDSELRREIIARQDEIVGYASAGWANGEAPSPTVEVVGARADDHIAAVQAEIVAFAESPLLDEAGRDAVLRLREGLAVVREDVGAVTHVAREVESAAAATRSIAAGLTKTFPIGWEGYPNCKPSSVDLRCARLRDRMPPDVDDGAPLHAVLSTVAGIDTATFVKWLVGVVLTGFMAGLGAPFWVQTVDRLLKLNPLARGANTGNDAAAARAAAVPATASHPTPRPSTAPPGNTARRASDEALARRRGG